MSSDLIKTILKSPALETVNRFSDLYKGLKQYDQLTGKLANLSSVKFVQDSLIAPTKLSHILGMKDFGKWYNQSSIYNIESSARASMLRQIGLSHILEASNMVKSLQSVGFVNNLFRNDKLESILSVQNHFSKIFSSIPYRNSTIYQFQSAAFLYNGISTSIAIQAAADDEENTLDIVEELSNRVGEAATEIYERGYITREDLISFRENVLGYLRSVSKQDWQWFIGIVITIILGFLPFLVTTSSTQQLPENIATKEDIQQFKKDILSSYAEHVDLNGIDKKLAVDVMLRVKPAKKSGSIRKVLRGTIVKVLNISNNWAYVSYIDESDGLPACGWMPTCYFAKSTFSKSFKERVNKATLKTVPHVQSRN